MRGKNFLKRLVNSSKTLRIDPGIFIIFLMMRSLRRILGVLLVPSSQKMVLC